MDIGFAKPPLDTALPMQHIYRIDYIIAPSQESPMLPHMHKTTDEIIFVIGGEGECRINNQSFHIAPGSVYLLRSKTIHCTIPSIDSTLEYCSIQLDPKYLNDNFLIGNYRYKFFSDEDLLPIMKKAFNTLSVLKMGDDAPNLSRSEWLYCNTLIALALERFEKADTQKDINQNSIILEVWKYIKLHYNEKITLSMLARKFHLSISTLSRQFYDEFCVSPIEFVIENRIHGATIMLIETDMNIKDISESVGYTNVSYFTKIFTSRKGCSPRDYRLKKGYIPTIRISSAKVMPSIEFEDI